MKCPTCPESVLVMSERQGVEIDYCPTCRGVWLDRGELDKIIERAGVELAASSAGPMAPAPAAPAPSAYAPPRREDYRPVDERDDRRRRDDPPYPKKRKKKMSFLEDLFEL